MSELIDEIFTVFREYGSEQYLGELSPASLHSLALQGGPYAPAEVAQCEASPFAEDAVRLRRWDDVGKVAGAETPDLEHYRPVLEASRRR